MLSNFVNVQKTKTADNTGLGESRGLSILDCNLDYVLR